MSRLGSPLSAYLWVLEWSLNKKSWAWSAAKQSSLPTVIQCGKRWAGLDWLELYSGWSDSQCLFASSVQFDHSFAHMRICSRVWTKLFWNIKWRCQTNNARPSCKRSTRMPVQPMCVCVCVYGYNQSAHAAPRPTTRKDTQISSRRFVG